MAENEEFERDEEFEDSGDNTLENVIQVKGMYNDYFLDYASYVILERAVPHLYDGLKPVQRRILHSLREMDDGRFHKVANAIGNTMKYHPHGDASIGDAMVQIGQKEILLDTQGNWGNILTGDSAAAPRYIEVKLSKFANRVAFNGKTTTWLSSYDGRNQEPETLPMKFPLLLAQGVEGIAVGLACKILPHNFVELIDGSIDILKGKKVTLYPDFPTGGMMDASDYNDGLRGGKIKVRARIKKVDAKTLSIYELPYNTSTTSLIGSILKANDRGKIKIKKVEDNTADQVEILIHLASNVSPDKTIDALYAFTDCEISISPNSCVIENDRPQFLGMSEMLRRSTERTKDLLKQELEIRKGELQEQWHFASLEKIFIEKRIYRDIEECETWEAILETIHKGLKPHIKHLIREVTDEDVTRLTEIRIKRISKFDSFKADEKIASLEGEIEKVQFHLDNLTDFAIDYFKELKKNFAEGRERKTEIKAFDTIDRSKVAVANAKLYANFEEGFIGTGLKRSEGEFVCDCSDIDDIIVFRKDGTMIVTRVSSKAFVGKDIIHAWVWKKGDKRRVYNCIYRDGKAGKTMVKRFSVTSITRDREYPITKGTPGSEVLYFTANPNGEAEVVTIYLKAIQRVKKLKWDIDFSEILIKGRGAGGNTVTKFPVRKVELKESGVSTLGARKIWFDETVQRLNADGRGNFLGDFNPEDKILVLMSTGEYKLTGFDLTTHFDENKIHIEKWDPERPISAVYYDGEKEEYYVKRFLPESTSKKTSFISDHENSRLAVASTLHHPHVRVKFNKRFKHTRDKEDQILNLREFIAVKGMKALGNRLSPLPVTEVLLEPAIEDLEAKVEAEIQAERAAQNPAPLAAAPAEDFAPEADQISEPIDLELPDSSKKGTPPEEGEQPTLF
ncbi:DNA gyrase/topoisomerase IV subunit A [Sanyastnella coralliicola]|uniref:DNA gyrase/topoisomerase IV subunit A n=1 Tax=Sanyastnella coralliicola TaxID=3069118 RepID=UPI0027B91B9B|nr:DNA gyrase/topoisomerase IV subunit A [Longitalea sp. SCSIO 12813]